MRVLIGAFACQPGRGSEPGAGWAVATGAARAGFDTVLITQRRNRPALEEARRRDDTLRRQLHPIYIGLPGWLMGTWDRVGLRGLQLYNMAWQFRLWATARRLHRAAPFDVAHHVTLSTDWIPSGLAFVSGLPLVWGPLGGGERVPRACRGWLGWRGRCRETVRRLTADPLRASLGRVAARRAALIVAQNEQTAALFAALRPPVLVRPHVFLERGGTHPGAAVGLEEKPEQGPRWWTGTPTGASRRSGGDTATTRRALFVGRLLGWKGVHLAVATMAEPEVAEWELHLVGDGPEHRSLARRIDRMGLGSRVFLHRSRPRPEVLRAMASADAFLFPSLRDAAGWAVAEAAAAGCPIVCVATGGPAELVRPGGGVAVEPTASVVHDLARALAATPPRPDQPGSAWDDRHLADLLSSWYSMAVGLTDEEDASMGIALHREIR